MTTVFTAHTRTITYLREKKARLDNTKVHAEFSQRFRPEEEQQFTPYVKTTVKDK